MDRRTLLNFGARIGSAALAATLAGGAAEARAAGAPVGRLAIEHIVDLTHVLGPSTPLLLPLLPKFTLVNLASHERDGFYANQIVVNEHHGTHFDAPIHFAANGWTTADVPVSTLLAPVVAMDIRERANLDADAALTPEDLRTWEAEYGRVPEGAVVVLHSGWSARMQDEAAMRNVGPDGLMHFPGFSIELAEMLVTERSIVGLATDTLSIDRGVNTAYAVHRLVSAQNTWMVEAVANLDCIPPAGAHVFVGAPKHAGGSGGPARLIAVW